MSNVTKAALERDEQTRAIIRKLIEETTEPLVERCRQLEDQVLDLKVRVRTIEEEGFHGSLADAIRRVRREALEKAAGCQAGKESDLGYAPVHYNGEEASAWEAGVDAKTEAIRKLIEEDDDE